MELRSHFSLSQPMQLVHRLCKSAFTACLHVPLGSCIGTGRGQPAASASFPTDLWMFARRAMAKPRTAEQKIKLLCLHGYTQNASTFSARIGSWRKGLKSRCEFLFIDAPFESTGLPGDDVKEAQGAETGGRSWWNWNDTGADARPSRAATYTGWDVTLPTLLQAVREHQPDGLLGFSQGATAAALLLASLQQADIRAQLGDVSPPAFSILAAGFVPRDPKYAAILQTTPVETPTLLIHGAADQLVSMERSEALQACFHKDALRVYLHDSAHLVPTCSGSCKQELVEFLELATGKTAASTGSSQTQLSPLEPVAAAAEVQPVAAHSSRS